VTGSEVVGAGFHTAANHWQTPPCLEHAPLLCSAWVSVPSQRLPFALGARRIDEGVQGFGGTQWVRMSDPEQNEFCVSTGVEW
jgi:hypothetical protein